MAIKARNKSRVALFSGGVCFALAYMINPLFIIPGSILTFYGLIK